MQWFLRCLSDIRGGSSRKQTYRVEITGIIRSLRLKDSAADLMVVGPVTQHWEIKVPLETIKT